MATYDYALGFEAWTGPAEKLPAQPMEPLPVASDAPEGEQDRYAKALSAHQDAKRAYEADLFALTAKDENWSQQYTPLGQNKAAAEEQVKEFAALHFTNPLVRNVGLYRTPVVKWEKLDLS
ncbi:hypothetical protein I5G61_gp36 [Mycobacterium phage Quesadilla]|uniref:Uncharacterized protein n=1 Tax=Mycobacterium phage Quesadilla TaxID=2664226 RepID=A0A5Q2WEH8_9CAUD|nr:hypothetical protein I5G61_gp36 [Mycobacterium phage Quesadilla]QGH75284.1 hypothetical protein SEA_QUESADILLA_36 [Mycobacterium phage Quesadilla]